jgi:hypothetical protein
MINTGSGRHARPRCPDEHELRMAIEGPLPPESEAWILQHLEWCRRCRAIVGIIPRRRRRVVRRTAIPLLVIVCLSWTSQSHVLDAAQLVQRATIAARVAHTPAPRRVRERFVPAGPGESVSVIRDGPPAGAPPELLDVDRPDPLAAAFDASPIGRRAALDIDAVAAFRAASSTSPIDRLLPRDRDGRLVVRMILPDREPREVELTLETETLRLVREVLVFDGLGHVEIEDLAFVSGTPIRATVPGRRLPTARELDHAALQAQLVLAQQDMDLSPGVRLRRVPDAIDVRIAGVPHRSLAERGATIVRLSDIDFVRVELENMAPVPIATPAFGLSRWLDRTFRSAAMRGSFGRELLQTLDAACRRLAALRDLSERYPDPQHQLPAATWRLLQQIISLHQGRLAAELNALKASVSALSGSSATVAYRIPDAPAVFLAHAAEASPRAHAFAQRVRDIAGAQDDLSADDRRQLTDEFAALWRTLYGAAPPRPPR